MRAMKGSMVPIAWYYSIKLIMQLPNTIVHFLFEIFTNKLSFGFSNVPGPKKPFCVNGRKTSSIGFSMPVGKTVPGSIGIISHAECVKAIITTDRSGADPNVLKEYFEKNLDEILGVEWRDWTSGPNLENSI